MATIKVDKALFEKARLDFAYLENITALSMPLLFDNEYKEEVKNLKALFQPKPKTNWFKKLFKPKKMTVKQLNKYLGKLMKNKVAVTGYHLANIYKIWNPETTIPLTTLRTGLNNFVSSGALNDTLAKKLLEERGFENVPTISYKKRLQILRDMSEHKKSKLLWFIKRKASNTKAYNALYRDVDTKDKTLIENLYCFVKISGWIE